MTNIGKRFIFGLPGKKITPFIYDFITNRDLLGVVLFNRNFDTTDDLMKLCSELKKLNPNLIIAIDQEGGEKSRIQDEFNHPSNREMAQLFKPEEVEEFYRRAALNLKNIGINMNLAPVVDMGKKDTYIEKRTFSDNPSIVTEYGKSAIHGIRSAGIKTSLKHFVGLGDSFIDPHKSLPVVENDITEHVKPFKNLSKIADSIMTTHIICSHFSKLPITISNEAVAFIRNVIGFNKPILTDDLLMGGSKEFGSVDNVLLQSFHAGHDIALICSDEEEQSKAYDRFENELKTNYELENKHNQSLQRIFEMSR